MRVFRVVVQVDHAGINSPSGRDLNCLFTRVWQCFTCAGNGFDLAISQPNAGVGEHIPCIVHGHDFANKHHAQVDARLRMSDCCEKDCCKR